MNRIARTGIIAQQDKTEKKDRPLATLLKGAVVTAAAVATIATVFNCGNSKVGSVNSVTPPDTTSQGKKKITIPPGLGRGAPLNCGASASNCVDTGNVSLIGNAWVMMDTSRGDTAVFDVIGQDSASYYVYAQIPLSASAHDSATYDNGLDSLLMRIDTLYSPSSARITMRKVCDTTESCKSNAPALGCGTSQGTVKVIVTERANLGEYPVQLKEIVERNLQKVAAILTLKHQAVVTFFRNDCRIAATATLTEGVPTNVLIGPRSVTMRADSIVEIHGTVPDSSYAKLSGEIVCPK